MHIRKQVNQLTEADLRAYAAWEYALDEEDVEGQDEATVRPLMAIPSDKSERSQVVLGVDFVLADGTRGVGIVMCPQDTTYDMADLLPALIVKDGLAGFWLGIRVPRPDSLDRAYKAIGKDAMAVFPATFESFTVVDGHRIVGAIEGFYHYDWEPGRRMYPFKQQLRLLCTR